MNALLIGAAAGWAAMLLASLVSMMAVFMGSGSNDLRELLVLQLALAPFAIGSTLLCAWRVGGPAALWRHTSGWATFAVLSVASLTMIAELTFVLIYRLSDVPRPWTEHLPAASALLYAVALAAVHAAGAGRRD